MAHFFSSKRNAAKRHASSLASPEPVSSPSAYPLLSPSQASVEPFTSPRLPDDASYASSSPVSPFPPQLPPIPRVASKLDKRGHSSLLSPQHGALRSPSHAVQDRLSPAYDANRPSSAWSAGNQPTDLQLPEQRLPQVAEHMTQLEVPPAQSSTHPAPSIISSTYSRHSKSQTSLMSGLSEMMSSTPRPSAPTTQPPKSGKSRLNLRNPMSLLMRRRSAQPLEALHDESLVTQRSPPIVPPMPDNYDPSIRGRIVHDFSAPRPNRNFSYSNAYGNEPQKTEPSPPKIEREHTPVFREHFDDDTSYEQSQAAIRAEQLVNKDFLKRNSHVPEPPGRSPPPPPSQAFSKPNSYLSEPPARSPPPPPPVAEDSPSLPPFTTLPIPPPLELNQDYVTSILSPVQEAPSPTDSSAEVTPRKRKSTKTPPSSRSRATSVTDPSFVPAGLPTHLTSRASRFSFQIGNGDSAAQEKILEERHIQKAAEKAAKSEARMSTNSIGDDYDDYGMEDDFDMDGGYEEDIPMLGEEADYRGLGDQTLSPGMSAFDFSSLSLQPNMNPLSPFGMDSEIQTLLDANGDPIGFAMSENALEQAQPPASELLSDDNEVPMSNAQGLGIMDFPQDSTAAAEYTSGGAPQDVTVAPTKAVAFARAGLDDDLYFDDGMIDEQGYVDAVEFDERIFDDPEGPLFDRKVKPPSVEELRSTLSMHPSDGLTSETGYEADDDTLSKILEKSEPSLVHTTSRAQPSASRNLSAYHSALADAANRAEADGRFVRKASTDVGRLSSDVDDSSSISNSRPSLIPDDGRFSQETTGFPPDDDVFGMSSSFVDDYEYSEYDSALDDELLIAEANSEALANDYEEFYGQEFGFYAAAEGEAVNAYGGYFGQSGLGRTVSGRNAMREPNLTPITERSEYSTRNSFISLHHFRDGTPSLTSPGLTQHSLTSPALAQLARISPYGWRDDEDMSLDSLMKLRKGAFGSTASLPGSTSGSPRNASPMGLQFVPRTTSPAGHRMREQNEDSFGSDESPAILDSLEESEEDDQAFMDAVTAVAGHFGDHVLDEDENYEDRPDSPTLTASDYNSLSSPTSHLQPKTNPPIPQMPLHSPPAIPMQSSPSIPLPTSPSSSFQPPPPLSLHTTFMHAPPSTSSPSPITAGTSAAPRRQSLGLISPISTTSPATPGAWRGGHSRKGSAADSVAYVREKDECGEGRWVLERRRTAESGELELVGREIVEGGRI